MDEHKGGGGPLEAGVSQEIPWWLDSEHTLEDNFGRRCVARGDRDPSSRVHPPVRRSATTALTAFLRALSRPPFALRSVPRRLLCDGPRSMITGGRGWEGLHTASHSGWSTTLGWDPRRRATSIHAPKGTTRDSHTVGPGACGCGEGEGGGARIPSVCICGVWDGKGNVVC